jgi:hypothetical protein
VFVKRKARERNSANLLLLQFLYGVALNSDLPELKNHHHPINVFTAVAEAFLMDDI